MSTLSIHPKDEAQERALKAIFDAFEIEYEKELEETEYLAASEANKKILDESIHELETGKGTKVSFDDLWK
ncbi:MAG: hypothetical protein JST32_22950 [Bacteroidetes bacterium]|nr:hypothetical protein [Bacteroidota bacterium]